MRNLLWATAALLVTLAISGCGREGIDLRGEAVLVKGSVLRETSEWVQEDNVAVYYTNAQAVKEYLTSKGTTVTETEQLSPESVRVLHISDTFRQTRTGSAGVFEETEVGCLQGVSVLGNKRGSKWIYNLETGSATPEQAKQLSAMSEGQEFADADLYPTHRVKVGDRWAVDPQALGALLAAGAGGFSTSSQGWMELRGLETRDGHRCARLIFGLQLMATIAEDEDLPGSLELSVSGEIYRDLDSCFDIFISGKGHMTSSRTIVVEGALVQASITGPVLFNFTSVLR